ncbi:MAG: type II CAAX endopeptidase family protein [Candidatus Nanopelagicales bacterium]
MNPDTEVPRDRPEQLHDQRMAEFHRLARASAHYRWWRPLVVGVAAASAYFGLLLAFLAVMALAGLAFPGVWQATEQFLDDPSIDMSQPSAYALAMTTVVLILPAIVLATRAFGAKPVGLLSSVSARIRGRWLVQCLGIAAAVYLGAGLLEFAMPRIGGQSLAPRFENSHALALVGLAVLLVPFQAAAEEYLFRGYLMQTLGAWFSHPAIAITLPVPLFVLGHGYQLNGMLDIAAFALVAGWLTWRTGGLEAAIALHVVNNLAWSVLGAFGVLDLNATDGTTTDLAVSLLLTGVFALAAVKAADHLGVARTKKPTSSPQPEHAEAAR